MKQHLAMTSAMAAALLALPGCATDDGWDDVAAEKDTAVCVDQQGKRVEDSQCERRAGYAGAGMSSAFLWYYLARRSTVPFYGDSINDPRFRGKGSFTPGAGIHYDRAPAAAQMTRSQAVARGGMGSRGRAFGSGRS